MISSAPLEFLPNEKSHDDEQRILRVESIWYWFEKTTVGATYNRVRALLPVLMIGVGIWWNRTRAVVLLIRDEEEKVDPRAR